MRKEQKAHEESCGREESYGVGDVGTPPRDVEFVGGVFVLKSFKIYFIHEIQKNIF